MALHRFVVGLLLVSSLGLTSPASANRIQRVLFAPRGDVSRVVFDLQLKPSYRIEAGPDLATIRLVFPAASLDSRLQLVRARDALIKEVRFTTTPSEVIGDIVLKHPGSVQHEMLVTSPPRVVIDIVRSTDGQARKAALTESGQAGDNRPSKPAQGEAPTRPVPAPSDIRPTDERTAGRPSVPSPQAPPGTPRPTGPPPEALRPEQLLERAEQQWTAQQIEAAQRSYTMFLQRYPAHPNNHLIAVRLGDILRAQGYPREALEAYTAVLQGYPGREGALISQIRLAELGATLPDLLPAGDEARYAAYRHPLATLQRLTQEYAFSPLADVARFKIGELLARQNDTATALDMFQQLLRQPLQDALRRDVENSLRQTLGQRLAAYQRQGAFWDVLRTFFTHKQFLAPTDLGNLQLMYPVVTSYAQLGLFDEAQSLLSKLREAQASPMPAHMALDLARLFTPSAHAGVVSALLMPLEQFTDAPMRAQALLLLSDNAWRHQRLNDLPRYEEMGAALLTAPAERAQFFMLLGQAYEALRQPDRAVQAFNRCAEGDEMGAMVETCLLRAAALHSAQGRPQDALALYQRVLHAFPHSRSNAGVLFRSAESYRQQADTAQMQATFKQLRESTQDAFWQKVATEYLEQAQWQDSLHERLAIFQNTMMR